MSLQVHYPCGIVGLTLTAEVYAKVGDAVPAATLTFGALSHKVGWYSSFTNLLGMYWFRILNGAAPFDSMWCDISADSDRILKPYAIINDPLLAPVPASYPENSAGEVLGNVTLDTVIALSRSVAVTGPRPQVGDTICLVIGDDYYDEDGRAQELAIVDENLPSWEAATIAFVFTINAVSVSVTGIIVDISGSPRTIKCEIPKETIDSLGVGKGTYNVVVTLDNGHITTIVKDAELHIYD